MSSTPASGGYDYATLEGLVTRDRLSSYLLATGRDLDNAFALYEWNCLASGAVLETVSMVEVICRNAMDTALTARFGSASSWYLNVNLDANGLADVLEARGRATDSQKNPEVHGKVVAEFSFGFWRYLTASRYLTAIWVPSLAAAFPNGHANLRTRRSDVEMAMQQLQFVRNRAAHHEPIHRRDLKRDYEKALKLLAWISPDASNWLAAKSRLPEVLGARPRW